MGGWPLGYAAFLREEFGSAPGFQLVEGDVVKTWKSQSLVGSRVGTKCVGNLPYNAASAIGDDRLQKQSRGQVVPDAFTHGTSQQRVRWFSTGFESGQPGRCDTFKVARL